MTLSAFFLILFFFFTIMGRTLQVFTWPSLDFLNESAELIREPEIENLRQAVVQISVRRREGSKILLEKRGGTGFNISGEGLIVTNRHVVENAESVIITFPNHGMFSASSMEFSKTADLALIQIVGEELPFVELSYSAPPPPGEQVTIIGNPLGYPRVAFRGEIEGYGRRGSAEIMEIDAPINPGSSGSPVFDKELEVVGIIYAVSGGNDEKKMGIAHPVSELRKLLD